MFGAVVPRRFAHDTSSTQFCPPGKTECWINLSPVPEVRCLCCGCEVTPRFQSKDKTSRRKAPAGFVTAGGLELEPCDIKPCLTVSTIFQIQSDSVAGAYWVLKISWYDFRSENNFVILVFNWYRYWYIFWSSTFASSNYSDFDVVIKSIFI